MKEINYEYEALGMQLSQALEALEYAKREIEELKMENRDLKLELIDISRQQRFCNDY